MRRKANTLVPFELAILAGSVEFVLTGEGEFYGYAMAKALRDEEGARQLTAHGTLYRALERLEKLGFLVSRWKTRASPPASSVRSGGCTTSRPRGSRRAKRTLRPPTRKRARSQ